MDDRGILRDVTANDAKGTNGLAAVIVSGDGAIIAVMHGGTNAGLEVPESFSQPICLAPETRVSRVERRGGWLRMGMGVWLDD